MKRKTLKMWLTIATILIGIVYCPIWIVSIIVRFIARLLLGISYVGLLQFSVAGDIFKTLFYWDDYRL